MTVDGTKTKGWLEFKYRATGEPIRFPVGTIHGAKEGPTLVVVGGMHGSEFAGIEAAIRLFGEVEPAQLTGTLQVGMIYNLPALLNNLGFLIPHDGKNPMSTFPGTPIGTYGEAMAYYFDQEVLSKADYFVELHGGDIPEALTPFVIHPVTGNSEVDELSRAMAMAYNVPLVFQGKMDDPAKPPRSAFGVSAMRGKPSILCESGQQGILKMEEVETHLVGLRNILVHLGMKSGQIVNTVQRIFLDNQPAIRSEIEGLWYPAVSLNDGITAGQVLGHIGDYFGDEITEITAPADALVRAVRTSPAVRPGDMLVEYGLVLGREGA
jgi:predicted deacylase